MDKHTMIATVDMPASDLERQRRDDEKMHPLVRTALSGGMDLTPETLRDLLSVQREWEAMEARKAYTRALATLKRELPTVIVRDKVVDFVNKTGRRTYYTHSSLAGAMRAVTEPLTAHGFSLNWTPSTAERNAVRVTCRLTHAEGHHEEASLEAPPDTSGAKNPAQAIASTVTLLQRYTALALLGIATDDMPDPQPQEQAEEAVDPQRNMTAVRALGKAGITREAAEKHVGAPVAEWTRGDRDKLRALLDAQESDGSEGVE